MIDTLIQLSEVSANAIIAGAFIYITRYTIGKFDKRLQKLESLLEEILRKVRL